MLSAGEQIELTVEKPAAGGRMIGRHEGQVVLVVGAIPGERVRARVERVERTLAFATTTHVLGASADRRNESIDLLCGGCLYSHIAYSRQLEIKSEVVADAFARIGRIRLARPVHVASSPEHGYRLRARFHVRDGRSGFYREGTHELCDVASTNQLLEESVAAVDVAVETLRTFDVPVRAIELSENLPADQRAIHLELSPEARVDESVLQKVLGPRITGCTARGAGGPLSSAGDPTVTDSLEAITSGQARGTLRRQVGSFFQANRYLLPSLVSAVTSAVLPEADVVDLYAGVGIFSAALAGSGWHRITAVEGDRTSGADLRHNARQFGPAIRVSIGAVESFMARRAFHPETIIVDPPRTGLSKDVVRALIARPASLLIYVSCDPPTMARDAKRLVEAGYELHSLQAFELFPNTPHVETLGILRLRDEKVTETHSHPSSPGIS
jgi:23S rRNA (uracil1939-C5)-methyltransferase